MNTNLLSEAEAEQLQQLIAESKHIVICAHKSPDGDAMGASLAWKSYLNQIGKTDVIVCMPDAFPDFLQWLPGANTVCATIKILNVFKRLSIRPTLYAAWTLISTCV